jgi:hypothetical protein
LLHAIFAARQPGFLLDDGDDALWQELKQERFINGSERAISPSLSSADNSASV